MMGAMAPRRGRLLVLLVACAGVARAEVLHERVAVGAVRCAGGVCWKPGRPGEAAAIVADGQIVPAPAASPTPEADEPIYAPPPERAPAPPAAGPSGPDAPPERRPGVAMDRQTGPEPPGTRVYHEPFNPAIFPFKRMTALDAVAADETLVLAARSDVRQRLPVLGAARRTPSRDAFWGSIVVDFLPGAWVPLPSVAADARILAARTEPAIDVVFARDGADNQYVMSPSGGRHRLVWLSDAPERYFAGEVPAGARLADEPPLPEPVPAVVRRRARKVLARLGVDARPQASLRAALDRLVAWFRAFEPGDPPPRTESTYLDLALARRGSCRHRSYAFVVTALAAGIPARYVENELHVFVEVYLPRVGWRRINLGGALVDEAVAGAAGKVPYRPKGADPFPQPPAFARGDDATPPVPKPLAEAAARAAAAGHGDGDGDGDGGGGPGGRHARVDLDRLDDESGDGGDDGSGNGGGGGGGNGGGAGHGARASQRVVATRVRVELGTRDSFRGDRVAVSGVVQSADGKPAGLPVEIYLDGPGGALHVGDAVAGADGAWRAEIVVPRDLPVGKHRVIARTPGDATRRPSRSR